MTVGALLASVDLRDAAYLLSHVLGRPRAWLIAHDTEEVDDRNRERFLAYCARRKSGEPSAYITESAGFYGREFAVNADVLIPRPETEHLVEVVLRELKNRTGARVLDVGTGSGAIACTLAAELPAASVDAVEVSHAALRVARKNATALGVEQRVALVEGDLLEPILGRRYDCVIANLPYVPTAEIEPAPDPVSFEPRLALDGGFDGLCLYRRMLAGVSAALECDGLLVMETAPPIAAAHAQLAASVLPGAEVTIGFDYAALERYVKVRPRR
ncbi:MAG: peptide chain release factor N(5)-glutamine methyltransferase [Candidatus Eremiobacteraeota bacterium]|nr:peptide chain release factor N(5)-glutamine methyltransferase [Candidatus Eremiobacteraeota bacterium]